MRFGVRRWLWRPLEYLAVSALKTVAAGVVFIACSAALMSWLGYPVPGLSELREYFEGVGRLSDLLS